MDPAIPSLILNAIGGSESWYNYTGTTANPAVESYTFRYAFQPDGTDNLK